MLADNSESEKEKIAEKAIAESNKSQYVEVSALAERDDDSTLLANHPSEEIKPQSAIAQPMMAGSTIEKKSQNVITEKKIRGNIVLKADDVILSEVVTTVQGRAVTEDTIETVSVLDIKESPTFGEKEFKKYFEKHYDKEICSEQHGIKIEIEFHIDSLGRPTNIRIKENSCPALNSEIERLLLSSPLWSVRDRKVTLQMELPFTE